LWWSRTSIDKRWNFVIAIQFRPNTAKALFHKLPNTFVQSCKYEIEVYNKIA
jgi:hypothetical protein